MKMKVLVLNYVNYENKNNGTIIWNGKYTIKLFKFL